MQVTLLILAVFTNLALGVFILSRQDQSATNRLFFGLTLTTAIWTVFNYLSTHQNTPLETLFFARWEIFLGALYSLSSFLTVHTFPNNHIRLARWKLVGLLLFAVLVLILIQTPFIFKSIEGFGLKSQVTPGPAIGLYGLFNTSLLVGSIITLITRMRTARGSKRTQLSFLLFAVLAGNFSAFVTNFILGSLLKQTQLLFLGPYFSLLFGVITAYAIIAHHLFDVRVFIRKTIVYSGLLLAILASYSMIVFIFAAVLGHQIVLSKETFITNLLASILISLAFDPLRKAIQERTDRFLFKKEYAQETVISELTQKLNTVINLDEALEMVMQTMVQVLHLHRAATFVFQSGENGQLAIKRIKQLGFHSSIQLFLDEQNPLLHFAAKQEKTLLTEQLLEEIHLEQKQRKQSPEMEEAYLLDKEVLKTLTHLKIAASVPLLINKQLVGLILLSDKKSQEGFTAQDLSLIEIISSQAITSIQKARLYEGEQLKTEFVSIASHELLTPISAIEGYLSMILDENIGRIDGKSREYLANVYSSARRLSQLIKDLLSVSRIEAGRMKFSPQSLDVSKLIDECINLAKNDATKKGVEVLYNRPSEPLPTVWADYDRVGQVVSNLIANAIKYTEEGTITVDASLQKTEDRVLISITDHGIGMNSEQQIHLFEKFYRVDSPETEGITGTGLGLYITKSVLEKMGSSIAVDSSPGNGTRFSFALPLFHVELSKL